MKKKILFVVIVTLLALPFIFWLTYPPIEGIYRTVQGEVLCEECEGYFVLEENKFYSIHYDNDSGKASSARLLGRYTLDGDKYALKSTNIPTQKLKAGAFYLHWRDYDILLAGEPLRSSELSRLLNPLKKWRINKAIDSL